jgi:GH18 family chitinase
LFALCAAVRRHALTLTTFSQSSQEDLSVGYSSDYPNVPDWQPKPEGYQPGSMVKYQGNIFEAAFWASEPGQGDPNKNGWRLYDELYDLTPHTPTNQARIVAYIPTWRKSEGFVYTNQSLYKSITHGVISFLNFDQTNIGAFDNNSVAAVNAVASDVVNTAHPLGTFITVSLGGATDYGFLYLMERIGANPSDPILQQVVTNVVSFVQTHNLDGVDLDLECWWDPNNDPNKDQGGRPKSSGPHPAGIGLVEFAQQLRKAMPNKIISATLFATSWYGNNYDSRLANYVDWLGIMTYDLTGSWNQSPVGPHTNLLKIRDQTPYVAQQQGPWPGARPGTPGGGNPWDDNPILSVEDAIWYWSNPFFLNWQGAGQSMPRNKLMAGVPAYGYDFAYAKRPDPQSGQIAPGYMTIEYKDILSQFPGAATAANGNIQIAGNTPRPSFDSAPGSYPYAHNVYFETPATALSKLNLLKSLGIQGIIIWELTTDVCDGPGTVHAQSADSGSIIQALYSNSGNPATRPPVGGTGGTGGPPGPITPQTWMSGLPDSTRLSRLTIPGTHETMARFGGPESPWATCQNRSLPEQLAAGIRFIDIRCRHLNDDFPIHHDRFFTGVYFNPHVYQSCREFLEIYPNECVIMMVKEEYTASNNKNSFEADFAPYLNGQAGGSPSVFWTGQTGNDYIPTLGEVRGKIVLVRRFGDGINAVNIVDTGLIPRVEGPFWDNVTFDSSYTASNKDKVTFHVQDEEYVAELLVDVHHKWDKIKALLDRAAADPGDDMYINYTSGTSAGALPFSVANALHPTLYDYLGGTFANRLGVIMMDFPDDYLIGRIYHLNYGRGAQMVAGAGAIAAAGV